MRVSLLLLVLSLIFQLAVAPEPIAFEPKVPEEPKLPDPKTREPTGGTEHLILSQKSTYIPMPFLLPCEKPYYNPSTIPNC